MNMKKKMIISVKKISIEDIKELSNLEYHIWRSTYRGILPDEYLDNLDINHIQEKFKNKLYDNSVETYLINSDMSSIGYFSLKYNNNVLEVSKLYILKNYQNIGVGSFVAEYIKAKTIEHHIDIVESWVIENNYISENFHKKMGFIKTADYVPLPSFQNILKYRYIKILTNIDSPI